MIIISGLVIRRIRGKKKEKEGERRKGKKRNSRNVAQVKNFIISALLTGDGEERWSAVCNHCRESSSRSSSLVKVVKLSFLDASFSSLLSFLLF